LTLTHKQLFCLAYPSLDRWQHWHRGNVRRVLPRYAVPIGRSSKGCKVARSEVIKNREATRRIAEAGDAFIGPSAIVPGSWPKAWMDGVYMPLLGRDEGRVSARPGMSKRKPI
jgi:hypothetical protein